MKNKLIELAKTYYIDLEINEEKNKSTEISILNDKLKTFNINNVSSYIVKAIKANKCIKLYLENIDNTEDIIKNILDIINITDNDNSNRLCSGNINNKLFDREKIDFNKIKEDLLSINNLRNDFPFINNIELNYAYNFVGNYINNSNSSLLDEGKVHIYTYSISVSDKDINKVVYETIYSKTYDFKLLKEDIINKLNILKVKVNSESIKTNKFNIILTNNSVVNILGTFLSMFDTKSILLKESILMDKFKEKVFSDKLSIIEEPLKGIMAKSFDAEGTKTTDKEVVKNGVFNAKFNNLEYAIKTNEEPSGNAGGVNNLYIKPGNKSFDELLSELDNGIIIDSVFGMHSGIDIKSGNISLQSEGLLVQNGKIVKGLEMIILSTNIFELFNNIIDIGNDLSSSDLCISAPSILFKDITIAGGKDE